MQGHRLTSWALLMLICFMSWSPLLAQSKTRRGTYVRRQKAPTPRPPSQSSSISIEPRSPGPVVAARPVLGLQGFDPVLLLETRALVPGSSAYLSTSGGQRYRFSSEERKKIFAADPERYVPFLAGDDVVAYQDLRKMVAGSTNDYSIHEGRIYLFASTTNKRTFDVDPTRYAGADILMQGFSPVSLVGEEVLRHGDEKFGLRFGGRRILLASEMEKTEFLRNPGRYYPSLDGIDPVSIVQGRAVWGNPKLSILYKNRLYVTSDPSSRDEFFKNPLTYSDLDVANEGCCPVTLFERDRREIGHFGISTIHLGQRFLFANETARGRFLQDPSRYGR